MNIEIRSYLNEEDDTSQEEAVKIKVRDNEIVPSIFRKAFGLFLKEKPQYNSDSYYIRRTSSNNYALSRVRSKNLEVIFRKENFEVIGNGSKQKNNSFELSNKDLETAKENIMAQKLWCEPYVKTLVLDLRNKNHIFVEFICKNDIQMKGFSFKAKTSIQARNIANQILQRIDNTHIIPGEEEFQKIYEKCKNDINKSVQKANKKMLKYNKLISKDGLKYFSNYGKPPIPITKKFEYNLDRLSYNINRTNISFKYQSGLTAKYNICTKKYKYTDLFAKTTDFLEKYGKSVGYILSVEDWLNKNCKSESWIIKVNKNENKIAVSMSSKTIKEVNGRIELTIGDAFANKCKGQLKEIRSSTRAINDEVTKKYKNMKCFGTYLSISLCKLLEKNNGGLSSSLLRKVMRNLTLSNEQKGYARYSDSESCFNLIPEHEIDRVVEELVQYGVIAKKWVSGTHADYYVFKPASGTIPYIEMCEKENHRAAAEFTEPELKAKLDEIARKDAVSAATWQKYMEMLLDHPGIYCACPQTVRMFMEKGTWEYKALLGTMRKIEEEAWKKKYYKALWEMIPSKKCSNKK